MQTTSETETREAGSSPATLFGVGDRVTWTHSSSNGSSWRFHTREGKVLEVQGNSVLLQMRNGRKCWQHVSRLTKAGETTELTKAFMEATA